MASFFEKLKKGVAKGENEKEIEKKEEEKETIKLKVEKVEKDWPESEGELAVDVYQTEEELVVQSAIAGVTAQDLNITLENDMLIIEGERKKPEEEGEYLINECFWGKFSRKLILPVEVNPEKVEATFKNGILMIRFQKLSKEKKKKILVKG